MASVVYAEVDNSVDVPFNWSERLCEPVYKDEGLETEEIIKYICEWNPFEDQPVEPEINVEPEVKIEDEPLVEETEEDLRSELAIEIDALQKRFIRDLETFEDRGTKSNADREYFELLKELATCQRGTQESSGVQTKSRFAVSTTWVNPSDEYLTSLDYTGSFGTLKKAIEECRAQHTILEPITLGAQYLDRANAQMAQPYHGDMATAEPFEYGKTVPIEELMIRSEDTANRTLCDLPTTAQLDYCIKDIPKASGGDGIETVSVAYHKYQEWLTKEHTLNTSVVAKYAGTNPIGDFITAQGGYEKAIEAIKWKKHFDETNPENMVKNWNE